MSNNKKLIIAGPGAGKTRNLVQSIMDDIENGVNPFMINAISFTRTAANEIMKRTDYVVNASTIHKVAGRIISLASSMKGEPPPMVLGPEKAKETMKMAILDTGKIHLDIKDVWQQISLIRELGVNPKTVRPEVLEVWKQYRNRMVSSGCIDLTGLLERAAREIQIEGVASYFSGNTVYLDEGQDTNPHLDWNVVGQLIKLSGKSVIYLSPSQVIYDFRGSDYSKLSDMLPQDIETVYMLENYRSTPEIVEAGIFMAESDAKGMKAVRKSLNIPVVVKSYNNPNDEADGVALTTGRLIKEGVNPAEIAILGRTWTGLFPIMEHLRMYGIPYNAAKNGIDLYDRPEILGLLEYITLANNPKTDTGLEILINFPFSGIGNRSKYIMRGLGRLTWDHIIESLTNNMVRPQVKERSSQLLDIREYLMEVPEMNIPVDQQLNKVLEISGIQKYLYEQLDYESLAAIETVTKMASEFATLREFEVYLKEQTIKRNIVKGGVTIKTLHASKGEEYDSVILPGWSEGNLPLTGASTNSEQRLGFVGVTRAKNRLVISYNKSAPPSRFLAGFPAVYV